MLNITFALFYNELKILRRDISPFVILFIMPIIALILLTPALGAIQRENGDVTASGIALSVPAMTVMFGTLGAAFLSFALVREYDWHCWPRVLTSTSSTSQLIFGKLLIPVLLVFIQQMLLLLLAMTLYGSHTEIQFLPFTLCALLFALTIGGFGLAVAATFTSIQKMNAVIHIAALLFAASSGGFIPLDTMPNSISKISMISPSYWLVVTQQPAISGELSTTAFVKNSSILGLQTTLFLIYARYRLKQLHLEKRY